MTRQTIATGSSANDGTGDTLRQAAEKINENFVEIYQKFGGDSDVLSPYVSITGTGVTLDLGSYQYLLSANPAPTANRTVLLPDASGNIVIDTATQTLTNKTLTSPSINEIINSGTLTLPTSTDTLVGRATSDTLTNKTIKNPLIVAPKIGDRLTDSAGNEFIKFTSVVSAVNQVTFTNSATGNPPIIAATGDNTHVNLNINSKGTGSVRFDKVAYLTSTITASGDASDEVSYIVCNSGSALAVGLNDGTTVGEFRIFTNKGAGTATVTPDNFAQGTSFAMTQYGAANCIWDGTNWYLTGWDSARVTVS
jgi:hypothetical protein